MVLVLAGCASVVNPVTGRTERTVMSEEAEVAEGAKAHEQVVQQYGRHDDPKLAAYVDELGQRLAKHSHRPQLKWTFTVLDSPELNAFALPGGYVYVTRGILATMESEADLAGVMGHEIGHVTARHGAQRATRQQQAGIGVLAASVLGAVLGIGDVANQVSQGVAAGYVASYSRDQELQADRLGAEYLAKTRYDPKNMVDVIQVLKSHEQYAADHAKAAGRGEREGADWLASHPSNETRLQDIRSIAASYPQAAYADDARGRFLRAIDGLPFGESRAQGVTRGQHFFHEPLGFALTAPAGWQVQNAQAAVALVNGAGDAGLVVRPVPEKAGTTHEEIIRNLVKPTAGRTERRELHGLAATHFVGTRQNAQGQTSNVVLTVVSGPQAKPYLLQYLGKDGAALQRALPTLREAEASFRPLSAADRAAARPWVLKTAPLPRGGFAELAKRSPLGAGAEDRLRLINGVYGTASAGREPKPGELVKVVE
ncbi:MAG TPA: M48 family metalloprotease [Methylibium sp.]|uniref:M48 family metalloprotease n=1 Tax=Methylibium sp. TaxID=2067992 RepID=UPI002DBE283F|nr:M48 family metalloprotease [Methylibium sp.]HEU4459162.1 M48 family metalloprotease [Methylibium sp.]